MEPSRLYDNAHLVVAAIRIWEFRNNAPPAVKDICGMLSISLEQGNLLCHQLAKLGIITIVEGGFDARLNLLDHLKIEAIPREGAASQLDQELERYQNARKEKASKFEAMLKEEKEKKKKKFAEIEQQLKTGLDRKKT